MPFPNHCRSGVFAKSLESVTHPSKTLSEVGDVAQVEHLPRCSRLQVSITELQITTTKYMFDALFQHPLWFFKSENKK
jgi:hypothetical protein